MTNQEIIERLKARNVGMFHTYRDFNEVLQYIDSWNDPTATQAALFTLNACDKEMIRELTPEPGTVTVTMTREQAEELLNVAAIGEAYTSEADGTFLAAYEKLNSAIKEVTWPTNKQ